MMGAVKPKGLAKSKVKSQAILCTPFCCFSISGLLLRVLQRHPFCYIQISPSSQKPASAAPLFHQINKKMQSCLHVCLWDSFTEQAICWLCCHFLSKLHMTKFQFHCILATSSPPTSPIVSSSTLCLLATGCCHCPLSPSFATFHPLTSLLLPPLSHLEERSCASAFPTTNKQ